MSFVRSDGNKFNLWFINFDKAIADDIWVEVKRGDHLIGLSNAETKVRSLLSLLESLESEADSLRYNCEFAAERYAAMQRELRESPDKFSPASAQEIQRKSPQALYDYAAALDEGCRTISNARGKIYDMLKRLESAIFNAQNSAKEVLRKIDHAVELMEEYLKVTF